MCRSTCLGFKGFWLWVPVLWVCTGSLVALENASSLESQRQQLQSDRDQQRLLDQRRERLRRDFERSSEPLPGNEAAPQDAQCWPLSGVRVSGVTLIKPQALEDRLHPLITPCMGVGQINQLLRVITGLYIEAGYVAARPVLVSEPEAGAHLAIRVSEGFVESIEWQDDQPALSLSAAFPYMIGKPLYLPDLEQGLDQLNRLRSVDLTVDIVPGAQEEGSRILLDQHAKGSAWQLTAGLDNLGSAGTGRDKVGLALSVDNPFERNDFLSVGLGDTLNQAARFSRSQSLYYNIPHGYWSFSLFAADAQYRAPVRETRLLGYSEGSTRQWNVRADRVLQRDGRHQLSAHVQLAHKRVESFFLDLPLKIQSPTLTVGEFGMSLFWLTEAAWNLDVSYSQGLTWLGADRDVVGPFEGLPKAQFHKYQVGLHRWQNGELAGQPWQWHGQWAAQYSPDPLPGIEQALLTDDAAVRGFRENVASGATSFFWRNTLSFPLHWDSSLTLTPRLGLDAGWLKLAPGVPAQRLAGASVGLALSGPTATLEIDHQRSVLRPDGFHREPPFWLMRLSLSI